MFPIMLSGWLWGSWLGFTFSCQHRLQDQADILQRAQRTYCGRADLDAAVQSGSGFRDEINRS